MHALTLNDTKSVGNLRAVYHRAISSRDRWAANVQRCEAQGRKAPPHYFQNWDRYAAKAAACVQAAERYGWAL